MCAGIKRPLILLFADTELILYAGLPQQFESESFVASTGYK